MVLDGRNKIMITLKQANGVVHIHHDNFMVCSICGEIDNSERNAFEIDQQLYEIRDKTNGNHLTGIIWDVSSIVNVSEKMAV